MRHRSELAAALGEVALIALAWVLVATWRPEAWPVAVLVTARPLVIAAWQLGRAQRGRHRASVAFARRFPQDPDHYV